MNSLHSHHHNHQALDDVSEASTDYQLRYQQIKKVTVVGIFINVVLALAKITLGFFGQSQALVADGVHSFADLISDVIVLFASKHGSREADEEHPYGHKRIETVIEVLLGIFLILVATGILIDGVTRVFDPEQLTTPTWYALIAAIMSIFAKEGLFHYTNSVARKVKSKLLLANAWHHRSDAISSVIALVGIAGSMLGYPYLDPIAAVGVSLMIAKVGWDISWNSLRELIDTALDEDKVNEIRNVILSVDGVKAVHSLRTRSMGGHALVDAHILVVNSRMSVSEGHQISEKVMYRLLNQVEEVSDVVVHIDPEDDENVAPNTKLPMRKDIEAHLNDLFEDNEFFRQRKRIILHYLSGKVFVELELPLSLLTKDCSAEDIHHSFLKFKDNKNYLAEVNVFYT